MLTNSFVVAHFLDAFFFSGSHNVISLFLFSELSSEIEILSKGALLSLNKFQDHYILSILSHVHC